MNGRLSPLPSLNTRPAQLQRLVRRFFKTSSERTKFPRASEPNSLERANKLSSSERTSFLRASEPASFERANQIPSLEQFLKPRPSNSENLARAILKSSGDNFSAPRRSLPCSAASALSDQQRGQQLVSSAPPLPDHAQISCL
ncbi:hypothetical protein [Candidatus Electronema sp. TJ]|uniref:hypothetical protein n=1 Tax=Candidatus Electronema sp. TJ TaxID=3401573 RepID=UPI003AA88020